MTDLVTTETNLLAPDFIQQLTQSTKYKELIANIETALAESKQVDVLTVNDVNVASQYLKKFKNIATEAEDARVIIVGPLITRKAELDTFFKNIPLMVKEEIKRLGDDILAYKKREDDIARAKAAEERNKLEEEALNNAIEAGVDQPAIVPEIIAKETKLSSINTVNVQSRKNKTFVVENEILIPREYLAVDEKKVKAERAKFEAVNPDGTEVKSTIPGVRFTYTEKVV